MGGSRGIRWGEQGYEVRGEQGYEVRGGSRGRSRGMRWGGGNRGMR